MSQSTFTEHILLFSAYYFALPQTLRQVQNTHIPLLLSF